jgi:uroporphyrinogen decarboxylase
MTKEINTSNTNRERFRGICFGKRPYDVSIIDFLNRPIAETPEEWVKQGASQNFMNAENLYKYFQMEHHHALHEIVCGVHRADLKGGKEIWEPANFYPTPPIVPVFPIRIVREDERHRVETTYGGSTVEVSKEFPWRMPKYIDRPVKDWDTWREFKKRLDPDTPERWPSDWDSFVKKTNSEDTPTCLLLGGYFGILREFMGTENLLFTFYDDPKLIEDMMEQILYLQLGVAKRALKDLKIDWVRFWEDMAFKSGPMISPAMFKKFMIPRYKKICDYLRSHNVDIIHVDSDGNIDELIPIWLDECGLNFHWPLEVASNMDAVALRKKYGKELILGGNIDKRVFAKGEKAIREEVLNKVPFLLETGGYFPSIDHIIPPDLSFRNFRYFVNLLREIGGKEKLPE